MTSTPVVARAEVDRCPGVLRPHQAADGALLRLRLPGGRLRADALEIVSTAAGRFANGEVHLTSRANLQLRGIVTDDRGAVHPRLVDEVVRAGLLPHPAHERVRNIVCSPLTGVLGGLADLRGLVRDLDDHLCSTPALTALPGPFLFVLDDGRGDVAGRPSDLGVLAVDQWSVRLLLGGAPVGPVVPIGEAAAVLVALASRFLPFLDRSSRPPVWHVRELPCGGRELLGGDAAEPASAAALPAPASGMALGRFTQADGRELVSVLAPLGVLTAVQSAALTRAAAVGSGDLIVTPWRGVVVADLQPPAAADIAIEMAAAGFPLTDDTPWRGLTACTGAPRCASGRGDTRSLSAGIARTRQGRGVPIHVVGCERRCGSPSGPHVEVLSMGGSVAVTAGSMSVDCRDTATSSTALAAAVETVAGSMIADSGSSS